ncbi:hypothetical protein [Granulicella sp. S156]|jgi:hypothetical protein|uniref:hypothetical protein n=1 Tax=Granulicella sp. S156 TaxID=1747224 RepID=UPI00131AF59A|nr:hypothetical protein [Granulicella sp. S156]
MSYGPYRYQNGNKYVFGSDGRWWMVTNSHGGDDYGYPVGGHTHRGHHPRHHAFAPPALPTHPHSHHSANGPMRRVGTAGFENPDNVRIRQLAMAINHQAGWIATWQGIGGFYGASLAGAAIIVGTPLVAMEVNEALLGPSEGRIFYESYNLTKQAMASFIESNGGRIITSTPLGAWVVRNIGFEGRIASWVWARSSMMWAWGAGGSINIFLSENPNDISFLFKHELPWLFSNSYAFQPFIYH